jgi:nucleoside-diphosphate-sugar epimerase
MRQSSGSIAEKRRRKNNVIFLTGGTGFLGSHMAVQLLKRGHHVILLCRPKDGLSARQRIERLFKWFNFADGQRLRVIEGEVVEPRFGLDDQTYTYLLENTDEVCHCLAETSFSAAKRPQIEKVNIQGTRNVLQLAAQGKCYFFHHMSTAYVAGQRQGLCKEEYVPQDRFHNAYEETKHAAEGHVLETCRREGIRTNIFRPSIVYGDSRSGRSLLFNAIYYPIRLAHYIKTICDKDYAESNGLQAEKMGVRRTRDGRLHASVEIEQAENGRLNLITIDFLVDACLAIMADCLEGDIFHVVNRTGNTFDELLQYTERFLNIAGIRVVPRGHLNGRPRNTIESLIGQYVDTYQAYLHDERTFDAAKAERILTKHNIAPPELDYSLFAKCAEYAIQVDWGRKLFA